MRISLGLAATAAWALAASAHAQTACAVDALNGLHVADVTVTTVKAVAAAGATPAYCEAQGVVVTRGEGAPDGRARFLMQLPNAWRQRFLFLGVGGNAGNLQASANGVDRAAALGKGYVTVLTDTGHMGDGTDASWARQPDGKLDEAKLTDFHFRAAHDVGVAGKAFAQAFYAAPIQHAYFDGCSTGGRMALVEAEHYPDDYTGIIAGDPAMDFNLQLRRVAIQKAALAASAGYIPPELLAAIDAKVLARCDGLDGAKDGLIQDPAKCPVTPKSLMCKAGETDGCLNADQARVLASYIAPMRDRKGKLVFPGWPLTDLSGRQGASDYTMGRTAPDLGKPLDPWGGDKGSPRGWELAHQAVSYWFGLGTSLDMRTLDIDASGEVIGDKALALTSGPLAEGDAKDPAKLQPFVAKGGKLILYHGASDPSIPPARTVQFYRELTVLLGGAKKTEANVRFFLVPGMHHCGGGVGPDRFDTLTALEDWVERGQAPESIAASTAPDAAQPHNLPLCAYPMQARYSGHGETADAANWSCAAPVKAKRSSAPA